MSEARITVGQLTAELRKLQTWTGDVLAQLESLQASGQLRPEDALSEEQTLQWIWQPLTRGCFLAISDLPPGPGPGNPYAGS